MQLITLVLDVRTQRVVFFSELSFKDLPQLDINVSATVLADQLPAEMTLANCYSYRFVSGKLVFSGAAAKKPAQTLAQANEAALRKALRERLDLLWAKQPAWQLFSEPLAARARADLFFATEQALLARFANLQDQESVDALAAAIAALDLS